jgi:hypothetical protein
MAISFVNVHEASVDPTDNNWTITKPTNTTTDDLMICGVVMVDATLGPTPPTGWTELLTETSTFQNDAQFRVYYRVCQAGDPASWTTGSDNGDGAAVDGISVVTGTYRGIDTANPFIGSISAVGQNDPTTLSSGTVNNTDAAAWAVGFGASHNPTTIDDVTRSAGDCPTARGSGTGIDGGDASWCGLWDSNGSVATGNRSHTVAESGTDTSLFSAIIILKPFVATLPPPPYMVTQQAINRASFW